MKLDGMPVHKLEFDTPNRTLQVYHQDKADLIFEAIRTLNLGASLLSTEETNRRAEQTDQGREKKLLWSVLLINFGFFVLELGSGFISGSMGLVADGLDMLADAIVYALSLYAVGHATSKKKRVARLSGYFQIVLAVMGFVEVIRRFFGFESLPRFQVMISMSVLALIGNAVSLYLLNRSRSKEAHMQASMIFTSNDVMVNLGVILAGVLVYLSQSKYPDLCIGALVFFLVIKGAFRILSLSK